MNIYGEALLVDKALAVGLDFWPRDQESLISDITKSNMVGPANQGHRGIEE